MDCNYKKKKANFERSCCSCGKKELKAELIRFVRKNDGKVELDKSGKEAGRGAYICRDHNCFLNVKKQHRLDKVLRTSVKDEDYDRLEKLFLNLLGSNSNSN